MVKSALDEEMKTKIAGRRPPAGIDSAGYSPQKIRYKWGNAQSEKIRMDLGEAAAVPARSSLLIDQYCQLWEGTNANTGELWKLEKKAYEIIGIDDMEDSQRFFEIKRMVVV